MIDKNCSDCINFKDGMCLLKKPEYCLNYDHFQWSPMIQISPRDLEEKYVSRLMFDEIKARAEKAEAEVRDWKIVASMLADELTEANSERFPISWEDTSESSPAWIAYVNLRNRGGEE